MLEGQQEHEVLERLLSVSLRWSVRALLSTSPKTFKKSIKHLKTSPQMQTFKPALKREEGRIVVYRAYFHKLLTMPMPLRDKLCFELPCLEGFRTGEIGTLKAEMVDIENGDIQVLDSKKKRLFTLPLDPTVAKHVVQLGVHEDFLICGRKLTGKGLSVVHINRIWANYCRKAEVPVLSPRMGRAFFACQWHFAEHKSMFHLMAMLRHSNIRVTQRYLEKLVDYEDLKAEFFQGRLFQKTREVYGNVQNV